MAVSVRMHPLLEHELEVAAKKLGKTKSQFIIDAVERALGRKDPYKLMMDLKARAARGEFGPPAADGQSEEIPPGADAREFIRNKLLKKHGLGGLG